MSVDISTITQRSFVAVLLGVLLYACADPLYYSGTPSRVVANPLVTTTVNGRASGILVKFHTSISAYNRGRSLSANGLLETAQFGLVPGLTRASVQPGFTLEESLQLLAFDSRVAYAEPDYILTASQIPNDPDFPRQYGLNNTGQSNGLNDADIDAPEAWDVQQGSNEVVIAVIDTGVDYNHPELRGNIWQNPDEIAGNGRDDDGNGYIDDVRGWNFIANNNNPMDDNDHGTHIAGVIGASGNNGSGIAGINWRVRIMPLKFMNATGAGATSDAIRAIQYAVRNGARISNNSWGGGGFSQALFDTIQAASAAGHLFVTASGNDGTDNDRTPQYPASFDLANVVAVAATDRTDRLASFSNRGVRSVDLAAPGVLIYSTVRNNRYASFSGTSMASPFVAGAAGLVLAQNPNLPLSELRAAILNNTDSVAGLNGQVATGGRLNVATAVNAVAAIPATPAPAPVPDPAPTPAPVPVQLNLSPANVSLNPGDSVSMQVTGGDGNYQWRVGNTAIASLDASNRLIARTAGATTVRVSDGSGAQSNTAIVTVRGLNTVPAVLADLPMNGTARVTVSGGQTPYSWQTDNTASVRLTPVGTGSTAVDLTPIVAGQFNLTVSDAVGNQLTLGPVQVTPVVNTPLSVQPASLALVAGDTSQLAIAGGTSPYQLVSSQPAIVSVDNSGVVSARAVGSATIQVTDVSGASSSVSVAVRAAAPAAGSLSLTPSNNQLTTQTGVHLTISGGLAPFQLSSSNTAVVEVFSRFRFVRPVGTGTAVVTVTDANGQTATANVTVSAPAIVTPGATTGSSDDDDDD